MHSYKIVFTGTTGAGKTTAIAAISDRMAMQTEVRNTDPRWTKATTTVAMDFGQLNLPGGEVLHVYGTPGQARFDFMWKILGRGALGLVILIDNRRPDPVADLDRYLDAFAEPLAQVPCVIGIGRTQTHPSPDVETYVAHISRRDIRAPVVEVNATRRADVLGLLDLLLWQLSASPHMEVS